MPSLYRLVSRSATAWILGAFVSSGLSVAGQTVYTSYDFTTLAGVSGGAGSADGVGEAALFNGPEGIAVDSAGNIYVGDELSYTLRKIAPGGIVTTLAGTPGAKGTADGTGPAARFSSFDAMVTDPAGNLYIADSVANTIRKVTPAGVVTTIAGLAGHSGHVDGPGSSALFDDPDGIAIDSAGTLYVSDFFNEDIRTVAPSGVVSTFTSSVSGPTGIAVDGSGFVYVYSMGTNTIQKISPQGVATTLAGTPGVSGYVDASGAAAAFLDVGGIAIDGGGNLFLASPQNFTIRMATPAGAVSTIAGLQYFVGSSSADGIGPNARFNFPSRVATDANGNVYVTDYLDNTIRVGHRVTQSPATVALGNLDQTFDGTPRSAAVTTSPAELSTLVIYDGALSPPVSVGTHTVFAVVLDPNYSGTAEATLSIAPGASSLPPFTTRHTQPSGNFLWSIAAGPPGLVTVGVNGDILSSPDGVTWTHRTSGTTNWLVGVTYGGGQFVAVGDNGCILVSPDGVAWQSVAQSATANRLDNVIYAAGLYVAVGEAGTIITSPDGVNWTARHSGVSGWLRGLTYTRELDYDYNAFPGSSGSIAAVFVAAGEGGSVLTSADGITWTPRLPNASGNLEALVTVSSAGYVGVGDGGRVDAFAYVPFNSPSGITTPQGVTTDGDVFDPVDLRGLAQAQGALFATGENGTILTASDTNYDGINTLGAWSQVPSGTSANLVGAVAVGDAVFIVGDDETILESTPSADSRLINLSCRSQAGTGSNALIAGFAVGGKGTSGSLPVLIRASGPALVPFGVAGTLADPMLQLYSTGSGTTLLAGNTGWGGGTVISDEAAALGAFPWANPASHDAALAEDLSQGPFTANITGQSGDPGVALAEIYDATPPGSYSLVSPRLVNLSARSSVGTGGNILIAGFIIGGSTPKTVLIRASGPALDAFGVSGTLPDPELQVYGASASGNTVVASNTGWNADPQIATAAAWVGAFAWGPTATKDSAVLVTLPPGSYTANVSGASGDTGVALIEVYEVE